MRTSGKLSKVEGPSLDVFAFLLLAPGIPETTEKANFRNWMSRGVTGQQPMIRRAIGGLLNDFNVGGTQSGSTVFYSVRAMSITA